MLVQVVHCHPLTDSYNHALFQAIVAALQSRGHEVVVTDLYREGFEPAMRAEERSSYFQPRYDDSAVSAHTDLLRRVDGIVCTGGLPCRPCSRATSTACGGRASPSRTIPPAGASGRC
jgi:putative NADPH-quinone reductase